MRPAILWAIRCLIFAVCGIASFLLRFDFSIPATHIHYLYYGLPIWIVVKIVVFRMLKLDQGWWRLVSVYDAVRILQGNVIASVASTVCILLISPAGFPRSIYFIDFILCLLAITGKRVIARLAIEVIVARSRRGPVKKALIYGAGMAGVQLVHELRSNPKLLYAVIGFVDDNSQKQGAIIQGLRVLGTGASLSKLVEKYEVEELLLALPSATGDEMRRILERATASGVKCRTMPALGELIAGRGLANQIRDVQVEDLLGRQPVALDQELIHSRITGKVVMITGAAGSIGSELCRQVALFRPLSIVGYDTAETPLFFLQREMAERFPGVAFHAKVGSIQNRARLREVLSQYPPAMIFHAAAYKHVPMMEEHVVEAIENNVLGTFEVARAAREYGVHEFILISSDKAVRPTNIMGATKRLAELVTKAMQLESGTTYMAVRFGNVLGSSGSVVPIFKQQIAAGGPITITDPEMRRYFMTIPEASQLVLQAASMGSGGETFVLDMGEPVKIVDLARNLVQLSGLELGRDIHIQFTGIRPGEKLFEELHTADESHLPTSHEKIGIFVDSGLELAEIPAVLDTLRDRCANRDAAALVGVLQRMVPEYQPNAALLHLGDMAYSAFI